MKTKRILAIGLTAILFTCQTTFAATTGELLQQGLYAEEVEGNIDAAIKAYAEIIKNGSAPPNHVAQALYRQGLCYLKIKNEAAARAALEKLVADYSSQTEILEKAVPLLDELTDYDPASLMPPETLVYLEFGSPGKQVETLLTMLKGTPFENPLAAMAGDQYGNYGDPAPGNIVGALLNPSMMAEFKKIRSWAVGITGMTHDHPEMIAVLFPGKSDALRGLLLAGLGMAGKPGASVEGLQTVILPDDMAVAYDDKVVIFARPKDQLDWCVKTYKRAGSGPTLASANKSFAKINKTQRQQSLVTLWANVDEAYAHLQKVIPADQFPPQLSNANAMLDLANIDDLMLTESIATNGWGSRLEFQLKDGHQCVAYDMIRTPHFSKEALQAVPADAVAVAVLSVNPTFGGQADKIRTGIQNATGLDIGREIFSNIQQVTLFALPAKTEITEDTLPGQFGIAITSRDSAQTREVLDKFLNALNPGSSGSVGQYRVTPPGQPEIYCYMDQANDITLLSVNRSVVDAAMAAAKNRKSITTSGPLSPVINRLPASTSKLLLVDAGGALQLMAPLSKPEGFNEDQATQIAENVQKIANAASGTIIELRTDEQQNLFALQTALSDLPPLVEIIGPVNQIAQINSEAQAAANLKKLQREKPAIVMPATKAPVIDGKEDEAWSNAPRYPLANTLSSLGSGESASPVTPEDLSAKFRALWDQDNLYLLVEVTDDKLLNDTSPETAIVLPSGSRNIPWWYDDCIEVYIDADNAKPTQYGENDAHYHFDWDQSKPTMGYHNLTRDVAILDKPSGLNDVEFAMTTSDNGYRVEIKFPWSAVHGKPAPGTTIGLDVHVSDDDDGEARDSKITWRDKNDQAYTDPQAFGNAELAGLVGWWKFDETAGTIAKDASGNSHSGTLVGEARWTKGKVGGAIDLPGSGACVRIADKASFDFGAAATVACWVNFRSVPAAWTAIVTKGDTAWRLSAAEEERQPHFGVNSFDQGGEDVYVNASSRFNANEWHHIAGTFDGSEMKLYVDGELETTKPWTGGLGRNDFEVLIGENAQMKNRNFDGLIDEVRVYNHALPGNQIKALASGK